ncbi:MAG: putative formate dehydrogenase-specific chaperone [Pseudolabrys sp.]|nr:putative formate dehydrogenase-specific chaperone [Pseudolabrys sp.]
MDRGLEEAIKAAGGVTELARRIGIAQPSVSNWKRIPSERVLAVEAATGVTRTVLRPDLFTSTGDVTGDVDLARARIYGLLGALLTQAPDEKLLDRIASLRGDASPLGLAQIELADAARCTFVRKVEQEFFDLFIGVGRGELLPYASYYLTGFLHERPLASLREDLAQIGIERANKVAEPEDHAGILCEIMAGMARGDLPSPDNAQHGIFEKHMVPWIGRFFADLERAEAADFYRRVGTVGRVFIDIETAAFALPS